ncbi:hypothetical protein HLPCO_000560 [Haloplasma contractile SSD-17B]|uniref:Uncharacterized protein n=1 Tax=Haloplasma contractile SSD-17B TaxID=1033810 RepID=U2EE17_9MOLU|nr:hypothetical protein HLPCO_003040 [Haloplasma contractile SSD-17B]ERJ12961.1 hypothetical protein HLPCO_000560 [Haloplasma contractile SSD-17B]
MTSKLQDLNIDFKQIKNLKPYKDLRFSFCVTCTHYSSVGANSNPMLIRPVIPTNV